MFNKKRTEEIAFPKTIISLVLCLTLILELLLLWLIPIFSEFSYIIDISSHFALQVTIVSILSVLILSIVHRKPIYLSLLVLIILPILPHLPFEFTQNKSSNNKTEIYYVNMNYFNQDYEIILQQIEKTDPEVVVILELNSKLDDILKTKYKNYVTYNQYALSCGIYTNQEVISSKIFNDTYPICTMRLKDYTIITTHPMPPFTKETWKFQNQYFEEIKDIFTSYKNQSKKPIIIGDFNSANYSGIYKKYFREFKEDKTYYTWNIHSILSIPIDHVLSKDFNFDVELLENSSDHSALLINSTKVIN